jgi:hypothetical protein
VSRGQRDGSNVAEKMKVIWASIHRLLESTAAAYLGFLYNFLYCAAMLANFTKSTVLLACVHARTVQMGASGLGPLRISTRQLLGSL